MPLLGVRNRCIGRSGASTSTLASNFLLGAPWTSESPRVSAGFGLPVYNTTACPCQAPPFPSLPAEAPARAHKSNIGCSGVTAWFGSSPAVAGRPAWMLTYAAAFLVPLARGWLCCLFLAICRALLGPCRKRSLAQRRNLRVSVPGLTASLLVPLGNAVSGIPVVVWKPGKRQPKHVLSRRGRCSWPWCRRLLHLCGLLHLPQPCSLQPWGAIVPVWLCNLPTTAAMARPEGPEDLPPASRRPHLVRPETLTSQVGVSFPAVPWAEPLPARPPAFTVLPRSEPWDTEGPAEIPEHDWLGVYVYTPHYATVAVAVSVPRQAGMQEVFDVLQQHAPGVPPGLMTCLEPLRPQRFDEYLHVIRYPGCIRGVHDGYAAVVADLTRVGGYYFATVLPRQISYGELIEYLTPLASEDDVPFRIFIGARSHPWPVAALVTLCDGDVITVVRDASFVPSRILSTQLSDRSTWGSMRFFFQVELHPCIGVLYGSQRYCIASHYHYGETIIEHLTRCLRLDVARITTCTFHTPDLDIQGSYCPELVTVHDVRPIIDTPATRARQDLFILCDMRPLGLKPVFVHAHVPTIHVPSLLSDFGVDLPSAFQVGIHGGIHIGDYVSVDCSCVLLFFVKEAPPDDSSDASSPTLLVPQVAPDAPAMPDLLPDGFSLPDRADPPWIDPSIPSGHSWNETDDFSTAVWRDFPAEVERGYTGSFPSVAAPRNTFRYSQPSARGASVDQPMDDTGGTSLDTQALSVGSPPDTPAMPDTLTSGPTVGNDSDLAPLPAQDIGHRLREFNTYIYVPDYLPEMITASVFMPCSVDAAMSAVVGAREQDAILRFPRLILASPQPDRWFLIALAVPNWLTDRPVVLLDCRRINQTMFAKLLHSSLNRESLLRAAGLSCRSTWDVYVHGLLHPLEHGQRITLVSGMLVTFVPHGCGAPATYDAAALLTQGDSWDLDAVVTAPGGMPGQHFWLLTDGMPTIFEVRPGRRPTFKVDIASHLQARDHALALIGAQPRIKDSFFDGIWTSGVIVATEQLSRLPCPPARRRDNRVVVIIDARAILRGMSWLLAHGPYLPTTHVTDLYESLCPREHSIVVFGADIVVHHATRCFAVKDGSVLTIDFFEDLLGAESADSAPPPDAGPDDQGDPGDDSPGRPAPGPDDPRSPSAGTRDRSRTPVRYCPSAGDHPAAGSQPTETLSAAEAKLPAHAEPQDVKWSFGVPREAFPEGNHSLTPATLKHSSALVTCPQLPAFGFPRAVNSSQFCVEDFPNEKDLRSRAMPKVLPALVPSFGFSPPPVAIGPKVTWFVANLHRALPESKPRATTVLEACATTLSRCALVQAVQLLTSGLSDFLFDCAIRPDPTLMHVICRLLQSPPSTSGVAGTSWEAARTATLRLGLPWPFARQGTPMIEPFAEVVDEGSTEEEATLIQAVFVLLTPGYIAEVLSLQILVPQSVEEILDLVDTCRAQDMRQWFPNLVPAYPQPDPRVAYLISSPMWLSESVTVCVDLTLVDGRVFAACLPALTDKHFLLNLAGLSGAAEIDLYIPGQAEALEYGVDVFVHHGMSITFVPPGDPTGPDVSLSEMLRSHLSWDERAAPDVHAYEDRFCLVAEGFFRDFLLQPSRVAFYLHDIAVLFGLQTSRAVITPARDRVYDAAIYGRTCRAVAAVGPTPGGTLGVDVTGILDCRPILEGWRKVSADQGWLDAEAVRHYYGQGAPPGFCVCLSGCRPHWRWLFIEPGQVVIVTFEPQWTRHDVAELEQSHSLSITEPGVASAARHDHLDPDGPSGAPAQGLGYASNYDRAPHDLSADPNRDATSFTCAFGATRQVKWKPRDMGGCRPSASNLPSFLLYAIVGCSCGGLLLLVASPTWRCILGAALFCHTRGRASFGLLCVFGSVLLCQETQAVQLPCHFVYKGHAGTSHNTASYLRPIATPCRARCLPEVAPPMSHPSRFPTETTEAPLDLSGTCTLLEEAACDPQCQAFFLAATLLETLREYFEDRGTVASPVRSQPEQVRLCSLIPYGAAPSAAAPRTGPDWPGTIPANPFAFPPAATSIATGCPFRFAGLTLGFTLGDAHCLLQAHVPAHSIPDARCRGAFPSHWNADFFQSHLLGLQTACKQGELICYTDGSFTPASPTQVALCGWARAFIDPHARQMSVLFGACDLRICPSDCPSAYLGECSGLLAAALASTAIYQWRPVHFLSDCTSALAVASGAAAYTLGGLAQTCRNAFSLRRAIGHAHDTFAYVPGHSGCFGNDVADALSKCGAKSLPCFGVQTDLHHAELWLSQGGRLLPWLGAVLRSLAGDNSLPPVNTHDLGHDRWHGGASPQQLLAPFLPPGVMQNPTDAPQVTDQAPALRLCVATFNTLSLGDAADRPHGVDQTTGLAFCPGRTQILANQLHSHDVQAVCLQETRCEQGSLRTHGFLRFCSGSARGQWGTEWWFREEYGFLVDARSGKAVSRFRANLFTKLFADPRRLFLRFVCGSFRLVFIGLHAPHRATERETLQTWWSETRSLIRTHARNDPIVMAGDMNASLGSVHSAAVGACGAETEDTPGEFLHAILQEFELIAPSTWEHVHTGPHHTYVQKRGHRLCRPDFVGVPLYWVDSNSVSRLAPAINAGHASPDHVAATFVTSAVCPFARPGRRIQGRRFKACELTGECAAQVARAISQFPEPSWDVSSHAHAAALAAHVQKALGDAIPKRQSKPYRSYLTDNTWALQQRVASVRRSLHRLQHHARLHTLAMCFCLWRRDPTFNADDAERWARRAQIALATHLTSLNTLGAQLKKACRRDRDAHIAHLADQLEHGPAPEVFQNLHALLGHRRRKKYQIDPLPAVAELDGQTCRDTEGTLRRWREHFGGMEGGREVSIPDLTTRWHDRICASVEDSPWPVPTDVTNIPTESDMHRLLVLAKTGKSPGMDGIPVEVGRLFAEVLAPHLHRIALKIAFRGSEPCGFKAGQAIWFYKGKGPHTACSSFRAILLLPVWAKVVHQSLRPPMKAHFELQAPSLQLGGKSQCTAVFGCHLVRSACKVAIAAGHSHFTLFADIASAYYCVIQHLVAKWAGRGANSSLAAGDTPLLPAACAEMIQEHLHQPTALQTGGASTWLEALTDSFQSDNFFLLRGDDTAVITSRGSRPGSSWADLIFAALVRRILDRKNQLRASHPGVSRPLTVPFDGVRCLDPCPASASHLPLSEVVWADDLAIPRITDPTSAAHAIGFESGILTDAFLEFGFSLSFGPHKTAGLLTLRGPGSRRARRAVFSRCGLNGQIPVLLEEQPGVRLPLVDAYRHLGCQQAPAGGSALRFSIESRRPEQPSLRGDEKCTRTPKSVLAAKVTSLAPLCCPNYCTGPEHGALSVQVKTAFSPVHYGAFTVPCSVLAGAMTRMLMRQPASLY